MVDVASAQEQLDALLKHMDRVLKENGIETKRRDEIIGGFVEKVPELLAKRVSEVLESTREEIEVTDTERAELNRARREIRGGD